MKAEPLKISRKHSDIIKEKISKSTFASEGNSRAPQKKNSRVVKFYDRSKSNLDHTINQYIALPPSADSELSNMKLQVGDAAKKLVAANYDLTEYPIHETKELPRHRIAGPIKQQLENFIQGDLFPGADNPLPQDMRVNIDKNVLPPPPLTKEILESDKPSIELEEYEN